MELEIRPLEGGIYLTRLVTDSCGDGSLSLEHFDEEDIVNICKIHDVAYLPQRKFYSLAQVKDYYASLHPSKVWLCYQTPYDEMIGLDSAENQGNGAEDHCFRQPLHWFQFTH